MDARIDMDELRARAFRRDCKLVARQVGARVHVDRVARADRAEHAGGRAGIPDLANHEHVERRLQCARHFGGNFDAPMRQRDDDRVGLRLGGDHLCELPAGVHAVGEERRCGDHAEIISPARRGDDSGDPAHACGLFPISRDRPRRKLSGCSPLRSPGSHSRIRSSSSSRAFATTGSSGRPKR